MGPTTAVGQHPVSNDHVSAHRTPDYTKPDESLGTAPECEISERCSSNKEGEAAGARLLLIEEAQCQPNVSIGLDRIWEPINMGQAAVICGLV
jgi:hypothetical protein